MRSLVTETVRREPDPFQYLNDLAETGEMLAQFKKFVDISLSRALFYGTK
jgi:hypothetical protein